MSARKGGEAAWLHQHAEASQATAAAQPSPSSSDAVYARLREQLSLRARLPVYQRRVARAESIIAEAMQHGPSIVMVSGGKDSTALLHLSRTLDPTIPAAFVDDGAQLPWTYDVLDALRALGHSIMTITTEETLVWMLKHVGMLGYAGPERIAGDWHWTGAHFREVLVDEPSRRLRDMGYPVQLIGLRAEESRGRLMHRKRRGVIYGRANGITIATPLADWEGADVLAYIVTHDLPLSPVYLQPDDPERDRRRTAAVYLEQSADAGDWHRIREHLPAFWQEITRDFPGMRKRA